jgi:fructose-1,6-bisphosphatase/inositol monophosphatase family enzyme
VKTGANELNDLLEFSVEIARTAGDITLKYFRRQPETHKKTDGSFVTIADREAEAYLRQAILKRFPDDGVVGEEEEERSGSSGRRWIIDPIDGTFAYVHGVPLFGVLIGLEVEGDYSLGVINIPVLEEMVYAAKALVVFRMELQHVCPQRRISKMHCCCVLIFLRAIAMALESPRMRFNKGRKQAARGVIATDMFWLQRVELM